MKKFLKIALGLVALFVVFVIAMGIYVVHGLPSISSLGSALHRTKSAAESLKSSGIAQLAPTVSAQNPETQIKSEEIIPPEDAKKSAAERAMVNDLMSTDKPLSDFCGSLKNSKSGIFNEKEFGQAFIESASDETKDPRIQAMKPMLRYVMRLPKVNELIKQAEAAVDRNDESFLKKAEFYSQAVTAFTEMKDHQADIESVMDRSYLLLQLSKIVAQKPELLTDARIQSYCSGVELAFN